jgi:hypothetical protein
LRYPLPLRRLRDVAPSFRNPSGAFEQNSYRCTYHKYEHDGDDGDDDGDVYGDDDDDDTVTQATLNIPLRIPKGESKPEPTYK